MKSQRPRKKKPEEINQSPLQEISLSTEDWEEFEHGVRLFNEGKFWHAHEAWEEVWQRHREDERLFFQGLIQLAAAYHHLVAKKSLKGMLNSFEKAYPKLEVFGEEYLGVHIRPLLKFIEQGRKEAELLDESSAGSFRHNLIPKLQFRKPVNPDLSAALQTFLTSSEFLEGIRLFNAGYHWEAHETWEDAWREQEGDAKTFAQAFVQMASAYSFIKLSKLSSARYLLEKAIEKFREFENFRMNVQIAPLIESMHKALEAIDRHSTNGSAYVKIKDIPKVSLIEK